MLNIQRGFKHSFSLLYSLLVIPYTPYNFTYFANSYNPLLSEFSIQNEQKIGGYPVIDFFINVQIQRTRLYLKAEHLNSSFTNTPNYYTAPNYPYRDYIIRFGLVWNFFI